MGIYTLYDRNNYYLLCPALALGRTIIECYINGLFVMKEDTVSRARELTDAFNEKRSLFKDEKWAGYQPLSKRAEAVDEKRLYEESYSTLCHFVHPSAGSY